MDFKYDKESNSLRKVQEIKLKHQLKIELSDDIIDLLKNDLEIIKQYDIEIIKSGNKSNIVTFSSICKVTNIDDNNWLLEVDGQHIPLKSIRHVNYFKQLYTNHGYKIAK